jgi:hypothetical protein
MAYSWYFSTAIPAQTGSTAKPMVAPLQSHLSCWRRSSDARR